VLPRQISIRLVGILKQGEPLQSDGLERRRSEKLEEVVLLLDVFLFLRGFILAIMVLAFSAFISSDHAEGPLSLPNEENCGSSDKVCGVQSTQHDHQNSASKLLD
jgi:hypothetical protein